MLLLGGTTAIAQVTELQEPGTGLSEQLPDSGRGCFPQAHRPYNCQNNVTGDWGGFRSKLSGLGIDITGDYKMEYLGNPVGGRNQGSTYVHNIQLNGDFALEKLVELPNSKLHASFSQRSGDSLSKHDIGNAFSVQQLYGGGQTYRLVDMQMYHWWLDADRRERLDLTYGRLAATDDFLMSPLYCQFVNNAFCGSPVTPFFNLPNGITAYPVATWGARASYMFPFEAYWMVGVYDGDPTQDGRNDHGVNISFGDNGVLALTEVGYTPQQGLFGLPGRYTVGGYYHSGDFNKVARDDNGNNRFATGLSGARFSGNNGYYVLLDQMFYQEKPDETGSKGLRPGCSSDDHQGLCGFFAFVLSPNQQENTFPYFYSAGLVYQGLLNFRPHDKTAIGITTGWFSDKLGDAQHDAGLERQTAETIFEINHQIQITPAIYVKPDLQYVYWPNGRRDLDNALVIGFETDIKF